MKQYIDKAVVMAEIERRLEKIANASSEDNRELSAIYGAQQFELVTLALFINTLEVEEDAVHGTVEYPLIGCDFPNIYPNYKELKEYCDRHKIKDNDKVKLVIIKEE